MDIKALLEAKTGSVELSQVAIRDKIELDIPYIFTINTKSMIPPKMIVADFGITNDFNTRYIPKMKQ